MLSFNKSDRSGLGVHRVLPLGERKHPTYCVGDSSQIKVQGSLSLGGHTRAQCWKDGACAPPHPELLMRMCYQGIYVFI